VKVLDTNVCIDLLRRRSPLLHQRFRNAEADHDELAVSSITAGELFSGALKSSQVEGNLRAANLLLSGLEILAYDAGAARSYGIVRSRLETTGRKIGDLDMLIAGHALANGAMLITNNTKEFSRVEDLVIQDWTK
jgi:tRNA(fMet)-specific endonuclease VapC